MTLHKKMNLFKQFPQIPHIAFWSNIKVQIQCKCEDGYKLGT